MLLDLGGASLAVEGDHLRALAEGWQLVRVGADLAWLAPDDRSDHPAQDGPAAID